VTDVGANLGTSNAMQNTSEFDVHGIASNQPRSKVS